MRSTQKWKLLAVAIASFAIAAMASGKAGVPSIASMHGDGGVADTHMTEMDAGMTNTQDMDGGMPNDLQGSLRRNPSRLAKTAE